MTPEQIAEYNAETDSQADECNDNEPPPLIQLRGGQKEQERSAAETPCPSCGVMRAGRPELQAHAAGCPSLAAYLSSEQRWV